MNDEIARLKEALRSANKAISDAEEDVDDAQDELDSAESGLTAAKRHLEDIEAQLKKTEQNRTLDPSRIGLLLRLSHRKLSGGEIEAVESGLLGEIDDWRLLQIALNHGMQFEGAIPHDLLPSVPNK